MSQNLLSLTLTAEELAAIDAALDLLEAKLGALPELTTEEILSLNKMGDKSEPFCREALMVLSQNPTLLPGSFNLTELRDDLTALDQLRPRAHRIRRLANQADGGEMVLGSDILNAALEGYAILQVTGKGEALETLRASMSRRRRAGGKKGGGGQTGDGTGSTG